MDRKKVIEENGKVFSTGKIECLEIFYKDKDYELQLYCNNKISETGLLDIGELSSNKQSLPEFIFRWDEKKEALDVDVYINDKIDRDLWELVGYKGHHSRRNYAENGRVFEIDIHIPNRHIFHGSIRVPVNRKLSL